MQLTFKYDLQKDTENFLKSFKSVNNKNPTTQQQLYTERYGEVDEAKVSTFIEEQEIDTQAKVKEIEDGWRTVEVEILSRMENIFGIELSLAPTVYLSSNSRCTYSIESNYFFVYMNGKYPNGTIAHELLHFYTWHAFHEELEAKGISKEKYNDIKEALTELLNTDFQDLLPGYEDKGYLQHQALRATIHQMRKEGKDVKEIIDNVVDSI